MKPFSLQALGVGFGGGLAPDCIEISGLTAALSNGTASIGTAAGHSPVTMYLMPHDATLKAPKSRQVLASGGPVLGQGIRNCLALGGVGDCAQVHCKELQGVKVRIDTAAAPNVQLPQDCAWMLQSTTTWLLCATYVQDSQQRCYACVIAQASRGSAAKRRHRIPPVETNTDG